MPTEAHLMVRTASCGLWYQARIVSRFTQSTVPTDCTTQLDAENPSKLLATYSLALRGK